MKSALRISLAWAVLGIADVCAQTAATDGASSPPTILLSIEGRVEVARAGVADWTAARTNLALQVGDGVRTGLRSRALLRLSDLSLLRVDEVTTMEILPPGQSDRPRSIGLKSGATYLFNREKPVDLRFRTPVASGAIRGTEFNLAVGENGRTVLTLLDGTVELTNAAGQITLDSGEQGIVEPGQRPRKTAVIDAMNVIQWALYYPGVLDPDDLALGAEEQRVLGASLTAYRLGDLLAAVAAYPEGREAVSPSEKIYRAATLLAVGQVEEAEALLQTAPSPLSDALRQVIVAVKNQTFSRNREPVTATEWMAESYYRQAHSRLAEARMAAEAATRQSPQFGFAWVRKAELEFSFGRTAAAMADLKRGLELSPRHAQGVALNGFLLAARNEMESALVQFNRAIAIDGALGNAWLGRGLCRIRQGRTEEGRQDLQAAATLEPQRALLRSYLGKAWSTTWDDQRAAKELELAKKLDPKDPTAWLYSALLKQRQNRINEAVRDLEKSQELNDHRSLFRSKLLLDQDRAVRSANLAGIYRDAGMFEVSLHEAGRAVSYDYANYSAHLFLARSYDALRDPKMLNLRYGTPYLSELLVGNLLAPVGAANLSQNVTQNEYSKLFQRDGLGISSSTDYSSRGDWLQKASQYGTFGNTTYAIDAVYRSENGYRPNNDLEATFFAVGLKQQLTPQDSILVQANRYDWRAGDVAQYYSPSNASTTLRVAEEQEPNLYLGYHREWSPGHHTLFLFGRLDDTLTQSDPMASLPTFYRNAAGDLTDIRVRNFGLSYARELEAYSTELQQIWQRHPYTVIAGVRYQTGDVDARALLRRDPTAFPPIYADPPLAQTVDLSLERISLYGYYQWQILEPLQLTAGLSYDQLDYPRNSEVAPLSLVQDSRSRVSPKAGLIYHPWKNTIVRGVYSQSLGGVFYDTSVRLEPTQVAGFNQAFRSLIPESVVGLVPGTRFETYGAALEQKFDTGTYFTLSGELLRSSGARTLGVFDYTAPPPAVSGGVREELEFRERSLVVTLNQLVGDHLALGARYRLTDADLDTRHPEIPASFGAAAAARNSATLQQLNLYALVHHRCGFFSEFNAVWSSQSNRGYTPARPGDDFWQFNAYVGYRFARRHAEVRLGIRNLTDRDYRLEPLTLYNELPRERTFVASLTFYF